MAMLVTHLAAATASLVWLVIEQVKYGKPSLVGLVTGTIAGLASITPASGTVGPMGGILLGLAGGVVCYYAVDVVKSRFAVDDSLDVLAVHGVGGATGTILVAFLANLGSGASGLGDGIAASEQVVVQTTGVISVAIWSAIITAIIVAITRALLGLRVSEEEEIEGLDFSHHGETAYRI